MTSPGIPEWSALGVPDDDTAEPDDADVPHTHDDAAEAAPEEGSG